MLIFIVIDLIGEIATRFFYASLLVDRLLKLLHLLLWMRLQRRVVLHVSEMSLISDSSCRLASG